MIEKHDNGDCVLWCDSCGVERSRQFPSWEITLDWKRTKGRELGWTSIKDKETEKWEDRCPNCNPFKRKPRKLIQREAAV